MKKVVLLVMCALTANANAAYYVEEDLPMTVAATIAKAKPANTKRTWETQNVNLPFCTLKKEFGPVAANLFNETLGKLQQAKEITIQSRPDVADKGTTIAWDRAFYIKNRLIKNGIPEDRIKTEIQPTYRASSYGSCGNTTIQYKILVTIEKATDQDKPAPTSAYYPPAQTTHTATIENQIQEKQSSDMISMSTIRRAFLLSDIAKLNKANTLALLENVYIAKQSGSQQTDEQIIIDVIIRQTTPLPTLIHNLAKPESQAGIQPPATTQPPPPTIYATPALARKENWVLDKSLTLRDNLNVWAKQASWNPSVWEASNYYQVTVTSTLEGDFPDVLRQIADSTGLNICAKKHEKYIRVTDANVSCKS